VIFDMVSALFVCVAAGCFSRDGSLSSK
jgi:hypothetical protein